MIETNLPMCAIFIALGVVLVGGLIMDFEQRGKSLRKGMKEEKTRISNGKGILLFQVSYQDYRF